jgi:hypothetical protein
VKGNWALREYARLKVLSMAIPVTGRPVYVPRCWFLVCGVSHLNMAENAFMSKGSYRVPLSPVIICRVFSGLNLFRL